jgi:hypothetical protein
MKSLSINTDPQFESVFSNYPDIARKKILNLRRLVRDVAREVEGITYLEETLKWGEPSFLVKKGSTVRMDWKKNKPDQYAIYFKCTSKLVTTFKSVYGDLFEFEGDRAIVFKMDDTVPEVELKNCIKAALTYHKVKQLPMLGM